MPKQSVLNVAVVDDDISRRDFTGQDEIEYSAVPYTTPEEFGAAMSKLTPDIVLLSEQYLNLVPVLNGHPVLILSGGLDVREYLRVYRKAVAAGAKGVVQRPVSYKKIVAALKGDYQKEYVQKSNVVYLDEAHDLIPPARTAMIAPKLDMPTVEEIKKEIRPVLAEQVEHAKTVTFFSAKGGVGKTLYSINTAVCLARMYPSKKIALVDFDLDIGDIAGFLNIEPRITALSWQYIPDGPDGPEIENYLIRHASGIYVLPAPIPPIDEEIFTYKIAHKILSILKKRFDVIIVDLGPTLRDVFVVTVEHANTVYVPSTPSIKSLRKAYDLVRIFDGLKIDRSKIKLLLTSVRHFTDPKEIERHIPYKVILSVPYIKQVEALDHEQALAVDNNRFRLYLEDLAFDILGKKPEKKPFWPPWRF